MVVEQRIAKHLAKEGRTQRWLAEQVGLTDAKISFAFNGQRELTVDEFERICKALKTSPTQFIHYK